jgi:hypothetical protein
MVEAVVERRTGNATASEAPIRQEVPGKHGRYLLRENSCDPSTQYRALAKVYIIRPKKDEWKPCERPEMVFVFEMGSIIANQRSSDKDFWLSVFADGSDASSSESAYLAERLSTSISRAEYGVVAVLSSEISQAYARQGKVKERDLFYSLSVEATAIGAKEDMQREEDWSDLFAPKADYSRIELSDLGKEIVEEYQVSKSITYARRRGEFGKTGWITMRSLPGDSQDIVADLKTFSTLPSVDMDFVRSAFGEK